VPAWRHKDIVQHSRQPNSSQSKLTADHRQAGLVVALAELEIFRQCIGHFHRELMGLQSPVDWLARLHGLETFSAKLVLLDLPGIVAPIECVLIDDAEIPDGMQRHRAVEESYREVTAAGIVAIDAMQRLMNIADQVDQKHQRFHALLFVSGSVGNDCFRSRNGIDNAVTARRLRTIALLVVTARLVGILTKCQWTVSGRKSATWSAQLEMEASEISPPSIVFTWRSVSADT
jgi:hypothetical protein